MKHIITFSLTVLITLFFISCKKGLLSDSYTQATIFKKWGILNDSTFMGVGVNNHPVKYVGQAGDYFDFRKDGYIYIKEGSTLDTLSYSFTSNTTLLIAFFGVILNGVPEKSHITNLTPGGVTISAPFVVTPGGVFGRKMILTR